METLISSEPVILLDSSNSNILSSTTKPSYCDINPILQALKEQAISSKRAPLQCNGGRGTVASNLVKANTTALKRVKTSSGSNVVAPEKKMERILTHIIGAEVNTKSKQPVAVTVEHVTENLRSSFDALKVKQVVDNGVHGLELQRFDFAAELKRLDEQEKRVDSQTQSEVLALFESLHVTDAREEIPAESKTVDPEFATLVANVIGQNTKTDMVQTVLEDEELSSLAISRPPLTSKKTVTNTWQAKSASKSFKKSTFMSILQDQTNENLLKKKREQSFGLVPTTPRLSRVSDSSRPNFPAVLKQQYIDPGILIVEKQLRAWEGMLKQMYKRRKLERPKRRKALTKFEEVGVMVIQLQALGLSPNLVNRVDRATLSIVLAIRLWKKKALDLRKNRAAPIRKLVASFAGQLATNLPVSIARSVIEHSLDILRLCHRRYNYSLGASHDSTIGIKDRMSALAMNLPALEYPIAGRIEKEEKGFGSTIIFKKSARVHPMEDCEDIDIELGKRHIEKFSLDSSESLSQKDTGKRLLLPIGPPKRKNPSNLSPFETIEEELERVASQRK